MTPTEPIDEFVEYYKQNNALPETSSREDYEHNRKYNKELFKKYGNNQSWLQEQCMKAGEKLRQDLFKFNDIAPMPSTTRLPKTIEEASDFFKQTGHHPPFESPKQSESPNPPVLVQAMTEEEIKKWKSAIHSVVKQDDFQIIKSFWFESGYRAALAYMVDGAPEKTVYEKDGTPSYTSRYWLVVDMNLKGKFVDEILFGNKRTNQFNNTPSQQSNEHKA